MTAFRRLLWGKFISDIGNYFDMIALTLYVYHLSQSALASGGFMAARIAGGLLSGVFSGIAADRISRKKLLIASDLIRCGFLVALYLSPTRVHFPFLFVVAFVLGVCNNLFEIALQSSVPAMVGHKNRARANAWLASSNSLAVVIGSLGAGTLIAWIGYRPAFLFDAMTYAFSALNLASLKIATSETGETPVKVPLAQEAAVVFSYLQGLPILLCMLALRWLDCLGSASQNIALPIFATQVHPVTPSYVLALAYCFWAAGKLTASLSIAAHIRAHADDRSFLETAFGISTVAMSVGFIVVFWSHSWVLIAGASLIAGVADGVSEVCFVTRLQEAPDAMRGRIFGVAASFQTLGFGLGILLASPLLDRFSPGWVTLGMHCVPVCGAVAFALAAVSRRRALQGKSHEHRALSRAQIIVGRQN